MQYTEVETQLDDWIKFRQSLAESANPLEEIADYWCRIRLIQYNHNIDPYYPASWPNPWQIISEGHYDDLTVAIMIGYTIKLTERYKDSKVEVRIQVDQDRTKVYNLVYVDDTYILNFDRYKVIKAQDIDDSFFIENIVELARPR
jgi:hypothetical protein